MSTLLTINHFQPVPSQYNDGSFTFRNSSTGTRYYAFSAFNEVGQTIKLILIQSNVDALVATPLLLQDKIVKIETLDYEIAMERQKEGTTTPVVVICNFTMPVYSDIIEAAVYSHSTVNVIYQNAPKTKGYFGRLVDAFLDR